MKYTKMIVAGVGGLALLAVLLPFVAFIVLHYFVLTPEYLTEQVRQEVNSRTHLRFDCSRIELEYLSSWPSVSLAIHDGEIEVPAAADADSLSATTMRIRFKKVFGNIQLAQLLQTRELYIENVYVEDPDVEIAQGTRPPLIAKQQPPRGGKKKVAFRVNQVDVADAALHFRHKPKGMEAEVQHLSLTVKGNLVAACPSFDVELSSPSVSLGGEALPLKQQFALSLRSRCEATEKFHDITLGDTRLLINQFPFELSGSLRNLAKGEKPVADVKFALLASSLKELLDFVPEAYLPEKKTCSVTGSASLEGEVRGVLGDSILPDVRLKGVISDGSFHKQGIRQGIDTISLAMQVCYRASVPDSCYVAFDGVRIRGLNSFLELDSRITNLSRSPFITADMKGNIDFDRIGSEFVSPELITLKGKMEANLSLAFNLKDLQEKNLNRIWADGTLRAKHIEARSQGYKLNTFVSGVDVNLGYKKNKSNFIAEAEVLSSTADIDTLLIDYDRSVHVNLSRLHLRANTALSREIGAATPVTAHLNCASLRATLGNKQSVSAENMEVHAGTKPSAAVARRNEAALVLKASAFKYLDSYEQHAVAMRRGEFIGELRPLAYSGKNVSLLKQWDFKGLLNFEQTQLYSSLFPLPVRVEQARVSFQNDQLILNHVRMQAGSSECMLSGMLSSNPSPKPGEPKLEGSLQLLSGNINYDELKETLLYGEALQEPAGQGTRPLLTLDNMEQRLDRQQLEGKAEEHPIYIPGDIRLDIQMDIDNMSYHEIELHQVKGNITLKDQQAYSRLSTRTNLGKADVAILYDSRKKDRLKASFDLDLKDVLVAQLPRVIPTVNAMLPLTESMDGLVNCHLTAEGILDNQMTPILSTTKAICSISGNNLILIDNKTFDEIAHKLRFKNKKRNVIDKLAADIILENDRIEVIPFLMEWDRYQAIIGGTHSTDFTYNYHVTLLKSPIPIDFGVDLSGKTDDMHYKIGKCKYKPLFKDGGVEHRRQTEERLGKLRGEITRRINL